MPNCTEPARSMLLCCTVQYGLESSHAHRNVLSQKIEKMASGTNWSKDETLKLLDIWGQENVQAQLEGCKKNHEKIAKELQEVGYERTYQQCRDKVKKLKGEYRKAKDKKNKTGTDNKHWDYFEPLDAILGHKPATQPPIIVDTAAEVPLVLMDDIEDLNDDDLGEPSPSSISTGQSDSVYTPGSIQSPCTPGQSSLSSTGQSLSSTTGQSSSSSTGQTLSSSIGQSPSSSTGQQTTSGQRKRKRSVKNEGVINLIEQMIERQTQSDIKMMELEESEYIWKRKCWRKKHSREWKIENSK